MNASTVVRSADGTPKLTPKEKDHWSEEDHRLVDLDTKLQNMILYSVPESLRPTLVLLDNSKLMWEELMTQLRYQGNLCQKKSCFKQEI